MVGVGGETGSSTRVCPGVGGYTVLVLDEEARMAMTLRAPDGTEHPLELWRTVTSSNSWFGDSVEWRVRGAGEDAVPSALVVEVRAHSLEEAERVAVYHAVVKVGPGGNCVTHSLDGATREQVLLAANTAPGAPCLAGM